MLRRCRFHRAAEAAARFCESGITLLAFLFAAICLTACNRYRGPDKIDLVEAPNAISIAEVRTYETRGTLSGNIRVILRGHHLNTDPEFSIERVKSGKIGWISGNVLLVVADKMELADFSTVNYVGSSTGADTVDDSVLVIPCLRSHMDCSPLEAKLIGSPLSVDFSSYSLDRHLAFWAEGREQGK